MGRFPTDVVSMALAVLMLGIVVHAVGSACLALYRAIRRSSTHGPERRAAAGFRPRACTSCLSSDECLSVGSGRCKGWRVTEPSSKHMGLSAGLVTARPLSPFRVEG